MTVAAPLPHEALVAGGREEKSTPSRPMGSAQDPLGARVEAECPLGAKAGPALGAEQPQDPGHTGCLMGRQTMSSCFSATVEADRPDRFNNLALQCVCSNKN